MSMELPPTEPLTTLAPHDGDCDDDVDDDENEDGTTPSAGVAILCHMLLGIQSY